MFAFVCSYWDERLSLGHDLYQLGVIRGYNLLSVPVFGCSGAARFVLGAKIFSFFQVLICEGFLEFAFGDRLVSTLTGYIFFRNLTY